MTSEALFAISTLFLGLFLLGTLACLPLYGMNFRLLRESSLWTKIIWWWPIFAIFVLSLYAETWGAAVLTALLISAGLVEYIRRRGFSTVTASAYFLFYVVAASHLVAIWLRLPEIAVPTLIVICFASVLSDVCAFFLGNYVGRHHLPDFLNAKKTWEGVAGQLIGAFIGAAFVAFVIPVDNLWGLALVIGVASAVGDLFNSAAKRKLNIKDWGQAIPGHGGFLDRFSSLSAAIAASYWYVTLSLLVG